MPSHKTVAAAFLLTGLAAANNPFTTIEVCPAATTVPACTVTAQHQAVSTCIPTTTSCGPSKSCSTGYSYSTSAWVSTVIPCGYDGTSISSCTVTKTDQAVPCSGSATTITSVYPVATGHGFGNGTNATTTYSTSYQTISKQWIAPYNKLGPLAIPGFDGCELCTDCAVKGDGSRAQHYDVTECTNGNGKGASCVSYTENRVSTKSAPASTTKATATNSMKTSVPSAGTYTFTFTNSAPAATITNAGKTYTQPAQPWFNYETRSCSGPTNFDFTVTVTKTITVNVPYSTSTGSPKPVDPTSVSHWGAWNGPASASATTTGTSKPSDPAHWGNWNNGASVSVSTTSSSASSSDPAGWGSWTASTSASSTSSYTTSSTSSVTTSSYTTTSTSSVTTSSYTTASTSSVTTSAISGPTGSSFVIPVNTDGGEDGAVVSGLDIAGRFRFDGEGYLKCDGEYIGTSSSASFIVFEKSSDVPTGPKFQRAADGSVSLPGAGFCTTDTTLFITFSASPANCKPVSFNDNPSTTSSTTGATTLSTTTRSSITITETKTTTTSYYNEPTTTSTTADPSADLDFAEPTPTPIRKRGGMLRKRME